MKINRFFGFATLCIFISMASYAEYPEENLSFLGYGDEMIDLVDEEIGLTDYDDDEDDEEDEFDEVDSTVEQLKELGVSRSINENFKIRSRELRKKNMEFWTKVSSRIDQEETGVVVSEETKATIKSNIEKALTDNGYKIVQLDIIPLSENSTKNAVRAVVRVVKPMKTGSYNEVQSRLNSIKEMCTKAATIDGQCMLSEMTTFIAENPRNNYYYEKTILR